MIHVLAVIFDWDYNDNVFSTDHRFGLLWSSNELSHNKGQYKVLVFPPTTIIGYYGLLHRWVWRSCLNKETVRIMNRAGVSS